MTRYDQLKGLQPGKSAVEWVDVRGTVVRPPAGSAYNDSEARKVVEAVRALGKDVSIGVVSPFSKQVERIKALLADDRSDVLVGTAHTLQGDERDIIVFSPVVSDGMSPTGLEFLRTQFNLFNVAITRARSRLIIVGDRSAAAVSGVRHLAALADYVAGLQPDATLDAHLGKGAGGISSAWRARARYGEIALCDALREAGLEVRPGISVEQYVLQLALRNGRSEMGGIDVEVDPADGDMWSEDTVRRLVLRDRRLMELGWKVVRFYSHEVEHDLSGCVERVGTAVEGH